MRVPPASVPWACDRRRPPALEAALDGGRGVVTRSRAPSGGADRGGGRRRAANARSTGPPLRSARPVSRVVVITGPSGVGKGTLIRLLREQVPELGLSVSATTRDAAAGRGGRASTTTSSRTPSSTGSSTRGRVRRARRVRGPQATGRCARSSSAAPPPASRSSSRSRSRARGRSATRSRTRCWSSSRRRRARRCASASSGAGPTPPTSIERRLRVAEEELDAQRRVRPRGRQRPPGGRRARAGVGRAERPRRAGRLRA